MVKAYREISNEMAQDIETVINVLLQEPILTLEDRLSSENMVPKEAHKYYNPVTGRCYRTTIPYASPP